MVQLAQLTPISSVFVLDSIFHFLRFRGCLCLADEMVFEYFSCHAVVLDEMVASNFRPQQKG